MTEAVEFTDLRLVAVYDSLNPYDPGTQPDFYCALAAELGVAAIVDLGCGTGMITCALAARGYTVIGADPAPAMVALARRRCGGAGATFIDGGAERLGSPDADLAIMTGHVAQFFISDEAWSQVLTALRAALRPGGHLAFESRHPAYREWDEWTADRRQVRRDPEAGPIEMWSEIDDEAESVVSYANHYRFLDSGDELVSRSKLRFRSKQEIEATLRAAGFAIERVYGDWDRSPPGPHQPEIIVVARRAAD